MDSWSRPSKHQATPAPFYLLPGGEDTPYCHSCGRVISSRRSGNTPAAAAEDLKKKTAVKYCSSRCRGHKPGRLDREIEGVFVRLMNGGGGDDVEGARAREDGAAGAGRKKDKKSSNRGGSGKKRTKGDARVLVSCDEVERYMFDKDESGSASTSGSGDEDDVNDDGKEATETKQAHAKHGTTSDDGHHLASDETGTLEDPTGAPPAVDYDVLARLSVRSGTRVRPPQSVSEVNGSVGGEKGRAERAGETGEMLERRREGLRRARRREMVRCAARRGVVFGFEGEEGEGEGEDSAGGRRRRRKCEAVMLGKVVEPSFAKGDWSVRWRE